MTSSQLRVTFGATQPKEEDIRAVLEVLRSGQLRLGRVCQELERLVSTAVGCPHTVAMSSCTAALHSCLSMIDVRGREVILPSLTFSATAAAIVHAGGIPRFAEVSPESLTLDCKHAERLITRKTAAMIPVHIFGIPCDMTTLGAMAKGHSIFLVEDCAYGLGSRWDGVSVGTVGTAGCFSFGVLKNVTTGEGGAVTVKEQDLAQRLREFRNYGMRVSRTGIKTHVCPGLNCKLTDIQAALGVSQLRRLENILEKKRRIFSWYNARLARFIHEGAQGGLWGDEITPNMMASGRFWLYDGVGELVGV